MKTVSLICSTQYGQTYNVASYMRSWLESVGFRVNVLEVSERIPDPRMDPATNLVIIGTPVYAGQFPRRLVKWVRRHHNEFLFKEKALFTVSLNAADRRPEARTVDRAMIRKFVTKTGFAPDFTASVAGSLNYRAYNPLIRFVMKRISAKAGGPTDTSRDYEMTDWNVVESFINDVSRNDEESIFSTRRHDEWQIPAKPVAPMAMTPSRGLTP